MHQGAALSAKLPGHEGSGTCLESLPYRAAANKGPEARTNGSARRAAKGKAHKTADTREEVGVLASTATATAEEAGHGVTDPAEKVTYAFNKAGQRH
jgi:hypothetical protein